MSANPTGGQTVLTFQTYNSTSNSFNSTRPTIALGDSDQGCRSQRLYSMAQKGTSLLLNAYDSRVASLAYSNGFVYGVSRNRTFRLQRPGDRMVQDQCQQSERADFLAAQGQITGAAIGSGVGVFNPSLAVDAAGDVLVNFTASEAPAYIRPTITHMRTLAARASARRPPLSVQYQLFQFRRFRAPSVGALIRLL